MKKIMIGTLILISLIGGTAYAEETTGTVTKMVEITQEVYDNLIGATKELEKANSQMEDFNQYIESIDVSEYQPMSVEELNNILND